MAVFTRRLGWVDNAETVNNAHAMALTIKKLGDQHNLLCRTVRVVLENLYLHLAEIGSLLSRSFQRRWFVLRGNLLFYFEKKSEGRGGDPAGVIVWWPAWASWVAGSGESWPVHPEVVRW